MKVVFDDDGVGVMKIFGIVTDSSVVNFKVI